MTQLTTSSRLRAKYEGQPSLKPNSIAHRFVELCNDTAGVPLPEARASLQYDDGTPCNINDRTIELLIEAGFLEIVQ